MIIGRNIHEPAGHVDNPENKLTNHKKDDMFKNKSHKLRMN